VLFQVSKGNRRLLIDPRLKSIGGFYLGVSVGRASWAPPCFPENTETGVGSANPVWRWTS